jgi:hypothetical protein
LGCKEHPDTIENGSPRCRDQQAAPGSPCLWALASWTGWCLELRERSRKYSAALPGSVHPARSTLAPWLGMDHVPLTGPGSLAPLLATGAACSVLLVLLHCGLHCVPLPTPPSAGPLPLPRAGEGGMEGNGILPAFQVNVPYLPSSAVRRDHPLGTTPARVAAHRPSLQKH